MSKEKFPDYADKNGRSVLAVASSYYGKGATLQAAILELINLGGMRPFEEADSIHVFQGHHSIHVSEMSRLAWDKDALEPHDLGELNCEFDEDAYALENRNLGEMTDVDKALILKHLKLSVSI